MAGQDPFQAFQENPEAIKKLLKSPESQTLAALFQQFGGKSLQKAAEAAAKGDPTALQGILNQVAAVPQGADALKKLEKKTQN